MMKKILLLTAICFYATLMLKAQRPFPAGLPTCFQDDFVELEKLYDATGGNNWTNKTNWFTSNNLATWYGVTLTNSCDVLNVNLGSNNLQGTLPNLNMPNLKLLWLFTNKLGGNIPNFNMPSLTEIRISSNQLTGSIPNFSMPNLKEMDLGINQLTGSIPNFNMPLLEGLALSVNQLTGSIPNFTMPNLKVMNLRINQLSGTIPNFNMLNLTYFDCYSNKLTGSIPNFNMPNLDRLYLGINQLSGTIPNFNMPNLTYFDCFSNKLTGSIPNFNMPILDRLYLSNNQLTGNIPNFNMPKLTYLEFTNNQLTGGIPNFNMPNLGELYLGGNQLTGTIPNFNMPKLTYLYIWKNQLTGSIPDFNMPNMKGLILNTNQLTGNIPNFNMPNLLELYLNNNQLSGNIPNFNMPKLTSLLLSINQLTGNIPNFNIPNLTYLLLNTNQLTGAIPNFNMPKLVQLRIGFNQLTGSIPNFNMPEMTFLTLAGNQLTGSLPNFNMPKLKQIYIQFNQLNGILPDFQGAVIDSFTLNNNKFVFGDIETKPWLNNAILLRYAPQAKIPLTYSNNQLIAAAGNSNQTLTYEWYKNGTIESTTQNNTYTPQGTGNYSCRVKHPTLSFGNTTAKMLILETEVVAVAATYVAMNLSDNFTNVTCYGGNNGSASVTISNGIAPYSYTWNIPNQSTNTVTNLTAGSYNVTVTDATGATIGKSFTVTQPTQLLSTTNITNATCNLINGSITLNTTGGTAPYTYQWQSSSNTSNSLNNISAGAYQVTVTDANNCKINNTYPLTTTIPPNLTVSSNPTICAGQSTTLTASGASTYQWSNGQNTPAIAVSPSQTTTYIVTATSNGCSVSKNIDVVVNTVNANISGKTNVCAGESTILTASGAASYQWNNGQNTPAITVSPSQTTTYVVTATSNGCSVSKTIDVVVNTVSTSISGKTIICAGESTILTASGASSYQWSNGQNTSTITVSPNQTTTYIVTATSNGCSLSKPIEVKVTALPKVPTITVNINQFLCNDSGNLQWYLNNTLILGANKTAYNATQSGTYYVTNTINGCSSSSAPIIFVLVSNNDFITKEDIKIYPNPAQNELTIDFQNIENNVYQLEIYSIEGRIFYSQYLYQPKTKIDITDISDGLYNIILKKENNIMYNYRFIKL